MKWIIQTDQLQIIQRTANGSEVHSHQVPVMIEVSTRGARGPAGPPGDTVVHVPVTQEEAEAQWNDIE